jgi:hypothetical protein
MRHSGVWVLFHLVWRIPTLRRRLLWRWFLSRLLPGVGCNLLLLFWRIGMSPAPLFQRDLKTVVKATIMVLVIAGFMSFDLPHDQTRVVMILTGRVLLGIIIGSVAFSIDPSFSEMRSPQLLPQTQLALWVVGLVAIVLATGGLQWLEPTANAWILTVIFMTFAFRAGFLWVWRRVTSNLRKNHA